MNLDSDRSRLLQENKLNLLQGDQKMNDMVTVTLTSREETPHFYHIVDCALIPKEMIEIELSQPETEYYDGMPCVIEYEENSEKKVEYLRFGRSDKIEPLVIAREFDDVKESYWEISEDFRLMHQLYHDKIENRYLKITDTGMDLVAVVNSDNVQIRLKEIRQYLAIKEMYLAIRFDYMEYSEYPLEALCLDSSQVNTQTENRLCWKHQFYPSDSITSYKTVGRLIGKKLLEPLPKSKSGLWGFTDKTPKRYVDFIVDTDSNGEDVCHSSDPGLLADYFGANPNAPHYLTPVFFSNAVLEKYYQQPSIYKVGGYVSYGNRWSIVVDTDHSDKVCAWLGDLGRDLPYEEQLHWRTYNTQPVGTISESFYKGQILAQFADSSDPEHGFFSRYFELQTVCESELGWQLLIQLGKGDEYHISRLRIPANDEQSDFDAMVLSLTHLIVDSLNKAELQKLISTEQCKDIRGSIDFLDKAIYHRKIEYSSEHITFLKKLQMLRSTGIAHRKGGKYKRIADYFGIDTRDLRGVFGGILHQATDVLSFYIQLVHEGVLVASEQKS